LRLRGAGGRRQQRGCRRWACGGRGPRLVRRPAAGPQGRAASVRRGGASTSDEPGAGGDRRTASRRLANQRAAVAGLLIWASGSLAVPHFPIPIEPQKETVRQRYFLFLYFSELSSMIYEHKINFKI